MTPLTSAGFSAIPNAIEDAAMYHIQYNFKKYFQTLVDSVREVENSFF